MVQLFLLSALVADDPGVAVVREALPSVAAVFKIEDRKLGSGTGFVVDDRGWLLTARHVVGGRHYALLEGRPALKAMPVSDLEEHDLALLRLGGPAFPSDWNARGYDPNSMPLRPLPLATLDDVHAGQDVYCIGNPGGRGIVTTRGIVSSTRLLTGLALALSRYDHDTFDPVLQFDAASNPGNSGGPLVATNGSVVGVVRSGVRADEGIHFAARIDTVRDAIPQMLHSELRHRFVFGVEVDPQAAAAVVTSVSEDSPFSDSVRAGDRIVSIGDRTLRGAVDFAFTTFDLRPGAEVTLKVERGGETHSASAKLPERSPRPAVDAEDAVPGLRVLYAPFENEAFGDSSADPSLTDPFDGDPSIRDLPDAEAPDASREDFYRLRYEGLFIAPETGLYNFSVRSDDGSQLFVGGKVVVDNSGRHAPRRRSGHALLSKGPHTLRIDYLQAGGERALEVSVTPPGGEERPLRAEDLAHRP